MKRFTLAILMLATLLPLKAANKVTTVEQVTGTVTLTDDVDYHITSTEPFATTGSIDITNTEHAVVIIDNLRPSKTLSYLPFIKINGEEAKNGTNCQVKVHGVGTIIMPYARNFRPLTTYTGADFDGDSCTNYGLETNNGFMVTLSKAKLNNDIRSFRLKRGYMVTFSLRPEGRGYSRCFIAADEDIAVKLPPLMAGRISSYRILQWRDVAKSGVVNFSASNLAATGSYWTYQWGAGSDYGIDYDCVPHMNHRYGPSISTLGSSTYSPNIKTDNEPGNSADPEPATVDEVLARWEDLMRTGKRLMTPSSHDGSMNWFRAFLDSIDARGWRCEVLDFHCYWTEGQFGNLAGYVNTYHRPIWISEFVWGASWNNNGIFSSEHNRNNPSSSTLEKNREVLSRILTNLNNWDYIERYCYWNDEANCSKIYRNGALTPAGKFFADMNPGVGYTSKYDYVPKAPRVKSPQAFNVAYVATKAECTLSWTEPNGELLDSIFIEVRNGNGAWERLATVDIDETKTSYSTKFTNSVPGNYAYRIHTIDYNKVSHYSAEAYNIINGSETLASSDTQNIQVGTITTESSSACYTFYSLPYKDEPAVVFGSVSNYNSQAGLVERVRTNNYRESVYSSVTSHVQPLTYGTQTDFYRGSRYAEYTSFISAAQGTGTLGTLAYEATILPSQQVGDTVDVTFTTPFNNTPVVLATPMTTSDAYPLLWRVFDVTSSGCRIVLQRQYGLESTNPARNPARISVFAIETGKTTLDDGSVVIVNNGDFKFTSSAALQQTIEFGDSLDAPRVLVQLQSRNRNVAGNLRTQNVAPDATKTTVRLQTDNSDKSNNTVSASNPAEERLGWIVIGKPFNIDDAIRQPKNALHQLVAYPSVVTTTFGIRDDDATKASVYSSNGLLLKSANLTEGQATIDMSGLSAGIYFVRTNAHHTTKIVKK